MEQARFKEITESQKRFVDYFKSLFDDYDDFLASGGIDLAPSPESVRPGIAPSCETCRFWLQLHEQQGACRRFPPSATMGGAQYFPRIEASGWCGEFKPILVEREQGGQAEKPNEAKV